MTQTRYGISTKETNTDAAYTSDEPERISLRKEARHKAKLYNPLSTTVQKRTPRRESSSALQELRETGKRHGVPVERKGFSC